MNNIDFDLKKLFEKREELKLALTIPIEGISFNEDNRLHSICWGCEGTCDGTCDNSCDTTCESRCEGCGKS